ncbi:NAD(P)H-binding protein [Alloactinosynnema sp. L-07]|uniref:NmrA family NAD(P)-binding protein n=1 Tax=Alloactinosynnema sp. L-07 TaxID=1653480 RepID=UPI0006B442B7|nr:NAD(P)H-binding protein [Alloactinosynnema sp. L-07]
MGETQAENQNPILVTGGTGKTGRRVAERLVNRGESVRIGSRTGAIPFDWEDTATYEPALSGARAAYISYYPDMTFPGAYESIDAFSKIAVENGVKRLVVLSGRGEAEAIRCEDVVRANGADWTILRGAWFAQNFSEHFLLDYVLAGEIALPAGDVAEPFVDLDDLADVAVEALTDEAHIGQIYEMTGPRLLTFAEVATEFTKALGREVVYQPMSHEDYAAALAEYGMPSHFSDLMKEVLDGRNAHTSDDISKVLGRPAKDFADYIKDAAATGVWNVS